MSAKFQLYKGYISCSDYNTLKMIENDIKTEIRENTLDKESGQQLLKAIDFERRNRLKIAIV